MEPEEAARVDQVLQGQLGTSARIWLYDRKLDTPMNFVLERAEEQLNSKFRVYWVENTLAEVFCLQGFSEPIVVLSERYVGLWAEVRSALVTDSYSPETRSEIFERLCLRLIAEMSLSKNNVDFATCAILQAVMVNPGTASIPKTVVNLQLESINLTSMACWFFGLLHELGHFVAVKHEDGSNAELPDSLLLVAIDSALVNYGLPPEILDQTRTEVWSNPRGHILGIDALRSEAHADIFATSVLLQSICEILQLNTARHGGRQARIEFDMDSFIREMLVSLNIIELIEICRRTAVNACTPAPQRRYLIEAALQPVAVKVRTTMVRFYLQRVLSADIFGERETDEQWQGVTKRVSAIMENLAPKLEALDRGQSKALKFSLDRKQRPTGFGMLLKWREALNSNQVDAQSPDVEQFCALAHSLNKQNVIFDMMWRIAEAPEAPFDYKFEPGIECTGYSCPWVVGKEFTGPFGMNTRHGFIVFVFLPLDDNKLEDWFMKATSEALPSGVEIKRAEVLAQTERQLRDGLALRLPVGTEFKLALQGTKDFTTYMTELMDGTIWPPKK